MTYKSRGIKPLPICAAHGNHNGVDFVVTMTSPQVTKIGRPAKPPTPFIRLAGQVKAKTFIDGWYCPAAFEVTGLPHTIRFTTITNETYYAPITMSTLEVTPLTLVPGNWPKTEAEYLRYLSPIEADHLPLRAFLRAALEASGVRVEVKPSDGIGGGRIVSGGNPTGRTNLQKLLGKPGLHQYESRRRVKDLPRWDSKQALIECARYRKLGEAEKQGRRSNGVSMAQFIADRTGYGRAQVRKQIQILNKPKKRGAK